MLAMASTAPAAANDDLAADLAARRAKVMERIGPAAMLVMWSAPVQRYSRDVDYEYRQDSNLYYLTGITQDETVLVLMPGNATRKEILFVRDRDPLREHWQGRLLSRNEASARSGIQTVMTTGQFDAFATAMLARRAVDPIDTADAAAFFEALNAGRGRLALLLDPSGVNDPLNRPQEFARRVKERFAGFDTVDATPILTELRLTKTPFERKLLARSLEISGEAQMAGMRAARPDAYEYEVEAVIEAVHRSRGAISWAYPSIVGSGPNATILHYTESSRQMKAGDLLLVDAACAYEYQAADITRTYPVSGRFSQTQKDIYDIVLEAQEAGIKRAQAGGSLLDIHASTVEVVKAGLLRLGLIADASGDQYRMWYTHNATHYIGLDVHDVGPRNRPLQPGMAFVIEPGIYVRQSALDGLPRTPDNDALVRKLQPAVHKYQDIGVRIEDAFLMEEGGLRRLTTAVPRTIPEIEAFLTKRAK
jgi:Xaa-Pro aminopeptidase